MTPSCPLRGRAAGRRPDRTPDAPRGYRPTANGSGSDPARIRPRANARPRYRLGTARAIRRRAMNR
jgi:hypothetical protein